MKKMFRAVLPHIIPELKLFFFKILWLGILIGSLFWLTEAQYIMRSTERFLIYGPMLGIAGIYLVRITAFVIKKILCQISYVIPDVYYDESKNNNQ